MMKTYVRMKFRDEVRTKDTSRIKHMMADARKEIEQMEYYHSVYEEMQRLRVTATTAAASKSSPADSLSAGATPVETDASAKCPDCKSAYVPPQAKFCSNCGLKRA